MDTRIVMEWTTRSPGSWSFRESTIQINRITQTALDTDAEKQPADPQEGERDPILNHVRAEPDRSDDNPERRLRLTP